MSKVSELITALDTLSPDEIAEIKKVVEQKWQGLKQRKLYEDLKEARNESREGKTLVLSSPEEIKSYFGKTSSDED